MRTILSFIAPETSGASIRVLENNQRDEALIKNPLSFDRSMHIDVRFHSSVIYSGHGKSV